MARFNFGALKTRILLDVFTMNMTNRGAQNELCRSTKTSEEVNRMVLSYERGNIYASVHLRKEHVRAENCKSGRNRWQKSGAGRGRIEGEDVVHFQEKEDNSEGELLWGIVGVTIATNRVL